MKKFSYILCIVFFTSCTSNTIYEKPKNVIPKDTMVTLLTDMYIASSAKNIKNKYLQKKINYMPLVYNKFKIDTIRFNDSNVYYSSVVEQYNEILLEVKKKLEAHQKFYTDSLKVQDSIKRAERKQKSLEKRKKNKGEILKQKNAFSKTKKSKKSLKKNFNQVKTQYK